MLATKEPLSISKCTEIFIAGLAEGLSDFNVLPMVTEDIEPKDHPVDWGFSRLYPKVMYQVRGVDSILEFDGHYLVSFLVSDEGNSVLMVEQAALEAVNSIREYSWGKNIVFANLPVGAANGSHQFRGVKNDISVRLTHEYDSVQQATRYNFEVLTSSFV